MISGIVLTSMAALAKPTDGPDGSPGALDATGERA
jgi:hypothetical protein